MCPGGGAVGVKGVEAKEGNKGGCREAASVGVAVFILAIQKGRNPITETANVVNVTASILLT